MGPASLFSEVSSVSAYYVEISTKRTPPSQRLRGNTIHKRELLDADTRA